MPTNLVLCVRNAIDEADLTASSAVTSLPASNLQLAARGRVWRSTDATDQMINFTWGGQGHFLTFLLLNRHNLESGSTWRVQLFSNADWTNQIYDTRVAGVDLPAYDYASLGDLDWGVDPLGKSDFTAFQGQLYSIAYFPRLLALSGTVTISNTGNSAGYMQASRLFSGDAYEFVWNPEAATFSWDEDTTQARSLGGSLRSDGGGIVYRSLDLQMTLKDEPARATLADMLRWAGLRKDVFLSLFPGVGGEQERDYTMLSKFVGKLPRFDLKSGNLNQATKLSFEEA